MKMIKMRIVWDLKMEKKNTHTYINTYVFFPMTEKGASGNENEKKENNFSFFFLELFSQIFPNQVKF